jgi:hypothetical protein
MDALGIAALIIDEVYEGRLDLRGYPLSNGATRVNHDHRPQWHCVVEGGWLGRRFQRGAEIPNTSIVLSAA